MSAQVADPQVNDTSTEHPHIVLIQKMDRQQAVIRGTRMPVWIIAGFYKASDTMDDILLSYPHLSPASVYDAISYYHDHQAEIEAEIAAQRIENVLKQTDGVLDERGFIHFPDLQKTKRAMKRRCLSSFTRTSILFRNLPEYCERAAMSRKAPLKRA